MSATSAGMTTESDSISSGTALACSVAKSECFIHTSADANNPLGTQARLSVFSGVAGIPTWQDSGCSTAGFLPAAPARLTRPFWYDLAASAPAELDGLVDVLSASRAYARDNGGVRGAVAAATVICLRCR